MEWSLLFRELGTDLNDDQLRQIDALALLILRFNKKQNLISKNDEPLLLERHIQDSLTPLFWISKQNGRHLDIGSGTGFPILPLAIAQPHRKFIGLEPRATRVLQMRHIAGELGLKNVQFVETRAEAFRPSDEDSTPFTSASARAVGTLEEDAARVASLLALGGLFITFKSSTPDVSPPGFRMEHRNYRLHPELKLYTSVCLEKIG